MTGARDPRFAQLDALIDRESREPRASQTGLHSASGLVFLRGRRKLTRIQRRELYLLETDRCDDLRREGLR